MNAIEELTGVWEAATDDAAAPAVVMPDHHTRGFLKEMPDALRYDGHTDDPDEVAGVIASLVPAGARILDVGCGTGSVTSIIAKARQAEVVGIEPDAARAARARERGIDVHVGVLTPEVLRKLGTFDVVLFADVLEHLAEPCSLLLQAKVALKPGGIVIASVPNVAHWSVRVALLRGRFQYESCGIMDATHLRWFDAANVVQVFSEAGMRIMERKTTAGWTLPVYCRRPYCWVRPRLREWLLRRAHKVWPTVFGVQYVVRAVPV